MIKILTTKKYRAMLERIAALEQDMQMVRFRTGENNVAAKRTQTQISMQHIEDIRQRREDAELRRNVKQLLRRMDYAERDIKQLKKKV